MTHDTIGSTTLGVADGLRLAADTWGEPPWDVVLLHGGGQTRGAWGRTPEAFHELGFSVANIDLRGHGESQRDPRGGYSYADHARDLVEILDPDHRAVLIGASLGGVTSLAASLRAPERIRAIVLVDIAPTMQHRGVDHILSFMKANPGGFTTLEEAADSVSEFLPHRPRRASTRGLEKNLRFSPDSRRWTWHWDPRILNFSTEDELAAQSVDMAEAVRRLDVPVILVRGEHSDVVIADDVDRFLSLGDHTRVTEVPEARHMVAGDENDVFLNAIDAELRAALSDWFPDDTRGPRG
jgi:pimeloyl-ACP methyl ester carboxylesterase